MMIKNTQLLPLYFTNIEIWQYNNNWFIFIKMDDDNYNNSQDEGED